MSESSPSGYDFMIEEYRQIVKVYDDLHARKNDLLKFYATIIGSGASVITLLSQITQGQNIFSFHLGFLGVQYESFAVCRKCAENIISSWGRGMHLLGGVIFTL